MSWGTYSRRSRLRKCICKSLGSGSHWGWRQGMIGFERGRIGEDRWKLGRAGGKRTSHKPTSAVQVPQSPSWDLRRKCIRSWPFLPVVPNLQSEPTNHIIHISWKHPRISGPVQFKPVLFKSQLYITKRGLPWWSSGWNFNAGGEGSIPGWGTKIPRIEWAKKREREREREKTCITKITDVHTKTYTWLFVVV